MIRSMYGAWNQPVKSKEEKIEEQVNRICPRSHYDGDLMNWTERHLLRTVLCKIMLSSSENEIDASLEMLKGIIMKKGAAEHMTGLFGEEIQRNKYLHSSFTAYMHEEESIRITAAKNAYLHILDYRKENKYGKL